MITKISLAVLFVTASLVSFGCDFGPPTPPSTPLTKKQVTAVLKCQTTIKRAGANFVETKLEDLEECLDGVLSAQLQFENGLIGEAQYDALLAVARDNCANQYQEIGKASSKLINQIVKACSGVEGIILPSSGYDPLEFGVLSEFADAELGGAFTDVTELAGAICGAKEEAVDWMVFTEVPRMGNLLDILNGDTWGEGPFGYSIDGIEFPNIPLDERCNSDLIFVPMIW